LLKIIDIGTGSGCIAISLASKMNEASVLAIDNSSEALIIAEENARLNNVSLKFVHADILESLQVTLPKADLIVSNPPYVLEAEKKSMSNNVLDYEPHEALFVPDGDPLRYYKAIIIFARQNLRRGGRIYFEINEAMGIEMRNLLSGNGYMEIRLIKDINGKDRIISAVKNG